MPYSQQDLRKIALTLCVLIAELCERLTYYGISGNLVLYCTSKLHFGSDEASNISFIFTGFVYFVPLLGGWLADSVTGRFHTIWGSFIVYMCGVAMMPLSSLPYVEYFGEAYDISLGAKRALLIIGLILVAVGTGGIKSNVSPFGASQVASLGPRAVLSFFNWFYWFINVGSFISFSLVAYVQQQYDYFYGYIIILGTIAIGIIVFLSPNKAYVKDVPQGSALVRVFKIMGNAINNKYHNENSYPSFIDYARLSNGGAYPDDKIVEVVKLGRTIPVFLCFIVFWMIYMQMQTSFLLQGVRMNLNLGGLTLPAASLNIFNTVIILIATPLVDKCIYPLIKKITGKIPSQLQRIGFGMLMSSLSVTVAGILEIYRKRDIFDNGGFEQLVGDTYYNSSSYSILMQIPQFACVGLGEVFTSITGLEFAFSESPASLKGVVMGMMLCTTGLGSFLSSALVSIVNAASAPNQWIPNEINYGHLDYFCFLLAGLMIPNLIIFIFISFWYAKKQEKEVEYRKSSIAVNPSFNPDDDIQVTMDDVYTRDSRKTNL